MECSRSTGREHHLLHVMCRSVGLPRTSSALIGGVTAPRRTSLVSTLRYRLIRAVQVGALRVGDRIPGTRTLAEDLGADPRVVSAALRDLAAEGLVEMRPRSGVYLTAGAVQTRRKPELSPSWAAAIFAEGMARGVPAPSLPNALHRLLGSEPVRIVVVAPTTDQCHGLCRELRDYAGAEATSVTLRDIPRGDAARRAFRRTELFVTTEAATTVVRGLARRMETPFVTIAMRGDLFRAEWLALPCAPCFLVVADVGFARLARAFLAREGVGDIVEVRVARRDRTDDIPRNTPVYVTQAARTLMSPLELPGDTLPPARMIADGSLRPLMEAVLSAVARRGA
jgi:DNA-binding transcriptional regulator YhcF (GntR family)